MAEPPPTLLQPATSSGSPILTGGGIFLAIAALYFGRDIFVPFALAILVSFALTPAVNWLRRWWLPRVAAVLLAVTTAFILIAGIAFVVGNQLIQLANNLPTYRTTITQKIHSLQQSAPGGGVVDKVTTTIQDIGKEISGDGKPRDTSAKPSTGSPAQEPVTVRLESPTPRPLEVIQTVVGPLLAPLATAGLVVIFVIFVLLEREDLRDRFIKLVGAGDLHKSTQAINDAAARVSRYLLMQLLVNLTYGIPIGVALHLIGIPNAVLWGLLAAVLRFIPYLGPFLAALFPIALAVAVDPGWTMLFWVVGVFLAAELVSNNAIEPWLYGASTGLSSLAIILAAIFWTTLWGPVGLFLATPLTVCLVVIGRYVPQLEFLGVLLGSDPVLAPEERLYQRLLAGNLEEAVEIAEDYVDECSSHQFYDNLAIPALRLAENDRQRSTTDTNYRRLVADMAICVVREVADHVRDKASSGNQSDEQRCEDAAGRQPSVLCLGGRTELDRAGAEMAAQVLEEQGIRAKVLPPIAVSQSALGQLDLQGVDLVCLIYFHPSPQVYARYICRRLRRRAPHLKLIVCCWNLASAAGHAEDLRTQMAADAVFASLEACVDQVKAWVCRNLVSDERPQVLHEIGQGQLAALHSLGLASATGGQFDEMSRKIAQAFNCPIALISLVDQLKQPLSDGADIPQHIPAAGRALHQESLDAHVLAANEVVVSEDVTQDPRFADDTFVMENGIRFYAGAPLRTSKGIVIGTLSLIDTQARAFTEPDRRRLQAMADGLIGEVARHSPTVASETHGDTPEFASTEPIRSS